MEAEKTGNKAAAAMIAAMKQIGAVGKDGFNKFHKYHFRGIDQIYNAVHGVLADVGLISIPRTLSRTETARTTKSDGASLHVVLEMEYDFMADDGSVVTVGPVYGEGMDSGDKGSPKAMSVAHKYAFFQVFCIATEGIEDSDQHSPEVVNEQPQQQAPPQVKTGPANLDVLVSAFEKIGVTKKDIEERYGVALDQLGDMAIESLREIYRKLKNDPSKRKEFFVNAQTPADAANQSFGG